MAKKLSQASAEQLHELQFLSEEEIAQTRELALMDLWFFATQVLWPKESLIHYHAPLHEPICNWVGSDTFGINRLLLMPRGHRKTMLVTIAHSIWRIVKDPNIRIIVVSALDDTASHFTMLVKRQFQYNEDFLRIFPEYRVPKNQQFGRTYDFTHPLRTSYNLLDPTFRSFYLGAPVAGRRCDILLCDDIIEKRHVTTPEQADKSLKDFNDLIPIIDKTGKYNQTFVVGTRWSFNDVYGAMLGEDRGDEADPELNVSTAFQSIVRHCLEDEHGNSVNNPHVEGEPILPTVWTRELLLKELSRYRVDPKRGEEDWWKQYMNICISPSGRKFEDTYFDTWMPRLPGGVTFSFFALDTATKDEQILMRGDYTVALVCHFDAYGHLYLTDGLRSDKLKGMDLINELVSMNQRCKDQHGINVTNLAKEKVGEDTFFGWVRSEFNRARLPITTFPLKVRGQGRKYVRIIEALQSPAQARQIHFVSSFPESVHRAIVDEATHLGQWSHDDAVDALSLAFHPEIRRSPSPVISRPWNAPYNARIRQLSTKDTTPATFNVRPNGETPSPRSWVTHTGSISPGTPVSTGQSGDSWGQYLRGELSTPPKPVTESTQGKSFKIDTSTGKVRLKR